MTLVTHVHSWSKTLLCLHRIYTCSFLLWEWTIVFICLAVHRYERYITVWVIRLHRDNCIFLREFSHTSNLFWPCSVIDWVEGILSDLVDPTMLQFNLSFKEVVKLFQGQLFQLSFLFHWSCSLWASTGDIWITLYTRFIRTSMIYSDAMYNRSRLRAFIRSHFGFRVTSVVWWKFPRTQEFH